MSGLTPFEKGTSGNPGGKTKQQRKDEVEAAEISAALRLKMLKALEDEADGMILERLDAATLKLFKDSEDRAHGTPKQALDVTTGGEQITPVTGLDVRIVDAVKGDADPTAG